LNRSAKGTLKQKQEKLKKIQIGQVQQNQRSKQREEEEGKVTMFPGPRLVSSHVATALIADVYNRRSG
jgi:hypothetical protein